MGHVCVAHGGQSGEGGDISVQVSPLKGVWCPPGWGPHHLAVLLLGQLLTGPSSSPQGYT